MVMALAPFVQLSLQDRAGDSRGMLEHQFTPEHTSSDHEAETDHGKGEHERALGGGHALFPKDSPQSNDREHTQGNQRQILMGTHQLVHRLAVVDVLFRLKPRDYRGSPADRANHKGPE